MATTYLYVNIIYHKFTKDLMAVYNEAYPYDERTKKMHIEKPYNTAELRALLIRLST